MYVVSCGFVTYNEWIYSEYLTAISRPKNKSTTKNMIDESDERQYTATGRRDWDRTDEGKKLVEDFLSLTYPIDGTTWDIVCKYKKICIYCDNTYMCIFIDGEILLTIM